eukprot:410096-Amphidinium_carterae.1
MKHAKLRPKEMFHSWHDGTTHGLWLFAPWPLGKIDTMRDSLKDFKTMGEKVRLSSTADNKAPALTWTAVDCARDVILNHSARRRLESQKDTWMHDLCGSCLVVAVVDLAADYDIPPNSQDGSIACVCSRSTLSDYACFSASGRLSRLTLQVSKALMHHGVKCLLFLQSLGCHSASPQWVWVFTRFLRVNSNTGGQGSSNLDDPSGTCRQALATISKFPYISLVRCPDVDACTSLTGEARSFEHEAQQATLSFYGYIMV